MEKSEIESHIILQAQRAAKSALVQWYSGQWVRQSEQLSDLTNDLLLWYMTRPETRSLMSKLSEPEIMVTFRKHARQLLSRAALDSDVFDGKVLYSSESVKDALKGESTNVYLVAILPLAIKRLSARLREALSARYFGDEPAFPETKEGQNDLVRAHKALCDEVNVLYITEEVKCIGSKSVVFPDTVRQKGSHADPTAGTALALMKAHPSYKEEYLYDSPWKQIDSGAASEPVINFGPSGKYRLTATEAELFRRVPGLIDLFIDQKKREWNE